MRSLIFLGLSCGLALTIVAFKSWAGHSLDRPTLQSVEVSFRPTEADITLHEPVLVSFKVHNGLAQPIVLTLGARSTQFFQFSLTTPDGQVLRRSSGVPGEVSIVTLASDTPEVASGADYQEQLIMNQWFPFGMVGTYSLTSRLTTDIEVVGGGNFVPRSHTSTLRITPRDPARLRKVCAELANQGETAPNVEAAQFPMLALSYVDDPIAVPFLAQVLRAHALVYEPAIPGLERIGNDDAVEVLLSELNDHYGDIAELADGSLARMQNRIANPRLKETVREAVERSTALARDKFIKTQIAYLEFRSPKLQEAAIQSLMSVGGGLEKAEPILQRLANDPNQSAEVKSAARDALKKLHPSQQ